MRRFFIVWSGQLVSVLGTSLTGFGLSVWVFQKTGSVTLLSFVVLGIALPAMILSPFAGALVDRWDRRVTMLVADGVAGVATALLAVAFFTGNLHLWHVYVLVAVGSVGNAFQQPAWMAAVPQLVPKRQLGRASGLVQLNDAVGTLVAPVIAGALLVTAGLGAVLAVDAATFLVGVGTLAAVRFPALETSQQKAGTITGEVAQGLTYLRQRPGLLGLLYMYAAVNFTLGFMNVLYLPLILAFASEAAAGVAISVAGAGMVAGSLIMSAWGGPRRRVRGTVVGIVFGSLLFAAMGLRPSVTLLAASGFLALGVVALVNATSQVLWQTKVALDFQGRVFAIRRTVAQAIAPIAYLLAGPLADRVFEPMLAPGGSLAGSVGRLIGTGTGRGIGFMFILIGVLSALAAVVAYAVPAIRNLERDVPDAFSDRVATSGGGQHPGDLTVDGIENRLDGGEGRVVLAENRVADERLAGGG